MTVKITLLFQVPTNTSQPTSVNHRIGGWSESVYSPQNTIAAVIPGVIGPAPGVRGLCQYRAALLTRGAAIVGQRFQLVSPLVGPSQSLNAQFPGTYGDTSPVGSALLVKMPALSGNNIRRFFLRDIPNLAISDGEFNNTPLFVADLNAYFGYLSGYLFRGRDLTKPIFKIIAIGANGLVTATAPLPYPIGAMIRVLKTKDVGARLRGGLFQVTATGPSNTQVTLGNWPFGATVGGSLREEAIVYPGIDSSNISIGRLVTRKVGRPFTQFRGRRSARH